MEGMKIKGLKVNMTKKMRMNVSCKGILNYTGRWPCGVHSRSVDRNLIQ